MLTAVPSDILQSWGKKIVKIGHGLNDSLLFTDEALMDLIRENPDSVFEVATMDKSVEDKGTWQDAGLQSARPDDLFKAIEGGTLWTNLGNVGARDHRYQALLDDLMEQLEERIPGFESFNRQIGILISSPNARVFYHADVPGQALLHVRGEKRIWLYPGEEPYLNQRDFERVVTRATTEEITYDPSFEDVATVYDLKPGDGLFWPLNWPHRVVNGNTVNISVTVEYSTKATRRHYHVNYANGMMSRMFGYRPRSREISGAGFWAKAAMSYALQHSKLGDRISG